MATENEDKLSTKNETDIENVKTGLFRMTDEDIQNIFDHAFEDLQRSKLDPNHANVE
ncbi:hypothetical protein ACTXJF_12000 [Psychrobacter alimentarius]|uniref:hypothetical protein n=1 Tax=Psychrobacter alimentarius TaxID=261164 RepID=UPI003FD28459